MQLTDVNNSNRLGTITSKTALSWGLIALSALTVSACGSVDGAETGSESWAAAPADAGGAPADAGGAPPIDPRRSLAITDQPILVNFSLQRVLDQIVATSGVAGLTSLDLFHQWWDTQNQGPGLGLGAHCDDVTDVGGGPILNGYPYTCRATPQEGSQASCDPFTNPNSPCAYIPVGLFMRFDLAPEDGTNCGEYRIVYAKASGKTASTDRNLLIFEATLRNLGHNAGLSGCQRYVRAWAELSNQPAVARRMQLERFYFDGYEDFDPIVQFSNYGDNAESLGQVRTNQFVQPNTPRIWSLREFKLKKECTGANCALRFVPVTNKVNPFGPLFNPMSTETNAAAFQADFPNTVERLAATGLNGIGMNTNDTFNSGQSQANGSTETNYPVNFGPGPSSFHDAIQAKLSMLGSGLTPGDIVNRAEAMACAGCHRLSNNVALGGGLIWPPSLGFTHVSERDVDLETVGGVTRYRISTALTNQFLPHRKTVVENFLNNVPRPPRGPKDPIGGRFTH